MIQFVKRARAELNPEPTLDYQVPEWYPVALIILGVPLLKPNSAKKFRV